MLYDCTRMEISLYYQGKVWVKRTLNTGVRKKKGGKVNAQYKGHKNI